MFLAAGPAFKPGPVEGLTVLDILPLLLFLKGFPVADDFEGRLPVQTLDSALLASRLPRRIASYGTRDRMTRRLAPSADVDEHMLERLRALGYLK